MGGAPCPRTRRLSLDWPNSRPMAPGPDGDAVPTTRAMLANPVRRYMLPVASDPPTKPIVPGAELVSILPGRAPSRVPPHRPVASMCGELRVVKCDVTDLRLSLVSRANLWSDVRTPV